MIFKLLMIDDDALLLRLPSISLTKASCQCHASPLQGPSLVWDDLGGNHGGLRCGKGTTWEGGQRVPSIARWTGHIAPGMDTSTNGGPHSFS